MSPLQLLAAAPAGMAVAALVLTLWRPPRRIGPRLAPYTVAARARLGDPRAESEALLPAPPASPLARVLQPIARAAVDRLSGWLGHRDEEATALALEQAGITEVTPRQFRDQQFLYAAFGVGAGLVMGALAGPRGGVLVAMVGVPYGFLRKRGELAQRTKARRERMRAELWQVCPQLAVKAHASRNVMAVIQEFCAEAREDCEVALELRRALRVIEAGTPGEIALRAAAGRTAEPFAGRLYRTLADAVEKGGGLARPLLDQAGDVRDVYRDDRIRVATGRTMAMVIPTTLMAALMLLLIGAPVVRVLFTTH